MAPETGNAAASASTAASRLKVVVRRLPPTLPEDLFWKSCHPWIVLESTTGSGGGGGGGSKSDHKKLKDKKTNTDSPTQQKEGEPPQQQKTETAGDQTGAGQDASEAAQTLPTCTWRRYVKGRKANENNPYPTFSRAYILFKDTEKLVDFARNYDGHLFRSKDGAEYRAVVEFAPSQKVPGAIKAKRDARQGTIDSDGDYIAFLEKSSQPVEKPEVATVTPSEGPPKTTPLLDHLREVRAHSQNERRGPRGPQIGQQVTILAPNRNDRGTQRGHGNSKDSGGSAAHAQAAGSRDEGKGKRSNKGATSQTEKNESRKDNQNKSQVTGGGSGGGRDRNQGAVDANAKGKGKGSNTATATPIRGNGPKGVEILKRPEKVEKDKRATAPSPSSCLASEKGKGKAPDTADGSIAGPTQQPGARQRARAPLGSGAGKLLSAALTASTAQQQKQSQQEQQPKKPMRDTATNTTQSSTTDKSKVNNVPTESKSQGDHHAQTHDSRAHQPEAVPSEGAEGETTKKRTRTRTRKRKDGDGKTETAAGDKLQNSEKA